ncbi:response regulator [Actinorugispora endophytica]|uniref:LuxR family two component transcriptional regulator n=1 Tax=Actinorugispora endophytica TaxID=1605990 RepID=A0A4V3D8T5_9ACTN|nr:response regulator transcription factor [Actinorugispora endophytica]TDQ53021.1 LuxR family two component transcriptional regulator [Actinorugispora endophytica]
MAPRPDPRRGAGASSGVRIVLADDEPLLRAGIRAILSADPSFEVVAEAADGHGLVAAAREHRPDVALVDIQMPGLDGLSAIGGVRRASPGTAVVILTTFGRDEYISRALTEGVDGFVLKASDPRDLLAGVRAVADGGAYLSPRVAERVVAAYTGDRARPRAAARERVAALSPRERDVLALVGAGLTNSEIARRLFLSEDTVKTHLRAVFTRLDVRNRVQAAVTAHDAGLVP